MCIVLAGAQWLLYGGLKMTREFVQAAQFSNAVYLKTARRYFYQMALLEIDFYLEILDQLKNLVLSYLAGATQHKGTGIY